MRTPGKPRWVAPAPRAARLTTARATDRTRRGGRKPGIHALDGLRAIAVALVLADHGGIPGMSGGFIGVDLFFVLSGFLITSLLIDELSRTGRIDLAGFWIRRGRRLLPALVLMVLTVAIAHELLPSDAVVGLREDAIAAFFWVANWRFVAQHTDYFTEAGTPSPLQHTWSLGVEEQYYFVWPLVLIAIALALAGRARRRDGRATVGGVRLTVFLLASAGAAASAAAAEMLASDATRDRVYFGTDTRAQALLIGAAAAALLVGDWPALTAGWSVVRSRRGRLLSWLLPLAGLAVLGVAAHRATGTAAEFRGGLLTLVAVAAIAVIAPVALHQNGPVARALAWPPLVWLGTISYGVYLWHWPVFLVLNGERTGWSGWALFAVRCAVTLGVAAVSWWVIEEPIRRWRPVRVSLLPLGAAISGTAVAVTVLVVPVVERPSAETGLAPDVAAAAAVSPSPPSRHKPPPRPVHHDPNRPRTVSVFGDSIGWTVMHYLPATPGYDFIDHTVVGCSIVRAGPYRWAGKVIDQGSDCDGWPARWARQVRADQPDVVLLFVGRWETVDRVNEGQWTHIGDPTFDAYLTAELRSALDVLESAGSRVVVTTVPYSRYGERPDGSLWPEDDPKRVDRWNALLRREVRGRQSVTVMDLNKKLGPAGTYTAKVEGIKVRSDGIHLTPEGVKWLLPWLEESIS
ncbi:acyltransferase family protein [[Mycobacterium] nativiensis]|uniref:Acyltransferase family protein n=1 Tax=[Mycobacterium] nativiensis TaxID=2855503 RepID=A0ABU5Y0V2_9MYCO|nr:acyltransferase family protein [Mycolicibacter sp. MYC340]MEB3033652.1 acyltransferase family protein [Mycolicibacter sp. MYC340]